MLGGRGSPTLDGTTVTHTTQVFKFGKIDRLKDSKWLFRDNKLSWINQFCSTQAICKYLWVSNPSLQKCLAIFDGDGGALHP